MGRALLKMSNEEIYESSLRFIFKQLDLYVEANKEAEKRYKNNSKNKGNNSEENKLMVLD
ncbi:hypothetical protein [uncultured Clostridium sp.]|jgi:hypothetical protein|uniref:hypothetical protein n=1 Tax=uncultured Clostridium sp. TaxID=59620 RepID=UPI002586AA1D|nr:hypothetical protein [uncultured Clostridium sp.]